MRKQDLHYVIDYEEYYNVDIDYNNTVKLVFAVKMTELVVNKLVLPLVKGSVVKAKGGRKNV